MNSPVDERACEILRDNDRGGYTVPTAGLYPYQWNWDSAFVALGFQTFDPDRAWLEIETLFEGQWADGFLPHIVFRVDEPSYFPGPGVWRTAQTPETSGITQPPVAASVVRRLYEAGGPSASHRLERLYPRLLALHKWFHRNRDPLNKGLVMTVHPWETGRDNSPEWDLPASSIDTSGVEPYVRKDLSHIDGDMRPKSADYDRYVALLQFGRDRNWDHPRIAQESPFRVIDVGLTMILLRADRDLCELARLLGRASDVDYLTQRISLGESGVDWLWSPSAGAFCSRDILSGNSSDLVTNASFLSHWAGVGSPEQRRTVATTFDRIAGQVTFMVPSTDPQNPCFDRLRYWRGPIWSVVNFMISEGLAEAGDLERASRVRHDTLALIRQSGFYEAFCPVTGNGTGGPDFSWTAAIWLAETQVSPGTTRA
jgi:hypothetical protein